MPEAGNLNIPEGDVGRPDSPFEAKREIRARNGEGASRSNGSRTPRRDGGSWPPGPGDGSAAAAYNVMRR